MHIGVLGVGRAGMMHARNLAQNPRVERVTLLGRDAARLDLRHGELAAALSPGAPTALAGDRAPAESTVEVEVSTEPIAGIAGELDGIVIATSTDTHPQFTLQAVQAGLPVLVEKPLLLDLQALNAFADDLDAYDAPVMVAFHRRYDPAHQALREKVQSAQAGRLRLVRATGHDHLPLSLDYIPHSGGIWLDMLIHDFDTIPWVTGERVIRVQAIGSVLDEPRYDEFGDTDTCAALLTLESGAIAMVTGMRRNGAGQDVRLEVFGSENSFAAGFEPRMPITSTEPGVAPPAPPYDQFVDRFEPAFRSEIDHFLRLIGGEQTNLTAPREGLHAVEIAVAATESRRTGLAVDISEDA